MQKNLNSKRRKTALNFVQQHPFVCCFNNLIKKMKIFGRICSSYFLSFNLFILISSSLLYKSWTNLSCGWCAFLYQFQFHYIHIYNIFIFIFFHFLYFIFFSQLYNYVFWIKHHRTQPERTAQEKKRIRIRKIERKEKKTHSGEWKNKKNEPSSRIKGLRILYFSSHSRFLFRLSNWNTERVIGLVGTTEWRNKNRKWNKVKWNGDENEIIHKEHK